MKVVITDLSRPDEEIARQIGVNVERVAAIKNHLKKAPADGNRSSPPQHD
ncbi:hypothetical protein [Devosia sp. Leaf64]|nr:hypothetical protein [Devosia sp. Leaf64]